MSIRMNLVTAEQALQSGDLALAESLCRSYLRHEPRNPAAICLLADIGVQFGRFEDAASLLAYCLEIAPDFHRARHGYADLLFRQFRFADALEEIGRALADRPGERACLLLQGAILAQSGRTGEALEVFDSLLDRFPDQAQIHLNRGRALQTVGRDADAVAEFRKALEIEPGLAEAWWSLADLKTYRFGDRDIVQMFAQLGANGASEEDRIHLSFALGKALEDRGEFGDSFAHYARGNATRRRTVSWDANQHHADVELVSRVFDAAFFASRRGWGVPSPAPIFIVGLPRAGSTLLEQILASHSRVEGTLELPDVMMMARRLSGSAPGDRRTRYAEALTSLTDEDFAALGTEYLERTANHRTNAPFFVDKMPNNFIHVGLIHLMLPNAKIIDARRNPMACGFSLFKQLFAHGQAFSYGLGDIGRYYRDYVWLMSHWDEVLPGRVLRVDYEAVVTDTERQVRRILAHCGLGFETGCLEFHRTERPVRTASSAQVRQPIYAGAVAQWRNYEPQLEALRYALEPVAE